MTLVCLDVDLVLEYLKQHILLFEAQSGLVADIVYVVLVGVVVDVLLGVDLWGTALDGLGFRLLLFLLLILLLVVLLVVVLLLLSFIPAVVLFTTAIVVILISAIVLLA